MAEPERDPAGYRITPADSILVGGAYFENRSTVQGVGAPVVAIGREKKSDFRKSFAAPRVYAAATAIIHFRDHRRAQIEFLEPSRQTMSVWMVIRSPSRPILLPRWRSGLWPSAQTSSDLSGSYVRTNMRTPPGSRDSNRTDPIARR